MEVTIFPDCHFLLLQIGLMHFEIKNHITTTNVIKTTYLKGMFLLCWCLSEVVATFVVVSCAHSCVTEYLFPLTSICIV